MPFALLPLPRLALAAALACGLLAAATAGAQPASAPAPADAASAPVDDSLYRALGERAGLHRLVSAFVPRLVADPRIGPFFKHANQQHLQEMLELQFCRVAGGGCEYTGLPMKLAHQDMDISVADFNALVEVLQGTMNDQGIAFATQNRLLARLAPMHRDIVNVH
jgi:hemoglobin